MKKISELSDYPSIKKLASALHQFDGNQHGAAIMIGAGFSRSAAYHVSGTKRMPLWYEFSKKLVKELNPNDGNLIFTDPLRVAEEYRAYFGQAALNDRVRFEIDDDAWRVGKLYKSLLELPWSEIMTTNWDTLLERAAKDVHSPYYTTVTKPTDLTWASSPRIVKLHGTIGTSDTFISAQEDYRTYPEKFAPFVNFARQVFIENELCLLGFSGDDPNFIHWAGWVRDHLAGHARKIYLVGVLNLTAARRKHLESINIAPIDLSDVVEDIGDNDLKHQRATELFLQAMKDEGKSKLEPHKWKPSDLHSINTTKNDLDRQYKEPEYAASLLKQQLDVLRKDRESYPGWLVCPPVLRPQIKNQLITPYPNAKNIAALDLSDRAKLLYEIAWQHSITFVYIAPWLAEDLFQFANPDDPCSLTKRQQMEIALVLLKNSHWLIADDQAEKDVIRVHIKALIDILEKHSQYLPDCATELTYYQILIARDALDYAGMENLIERITGDDPIWKLRQSALLMELGRFDDGKRQITEAYRELRERYRYSKNSIPILSRLTWAHWLLKAATQFQPDEKVEALPATFKDWECDHWSWIEDIQDKANKHQEEYIKNQNQIEPLFEQGHYRDNSNNRSNNTDITDFLLLEGLSRSVGIPLRLGSDGININLLVNTAEKLVLSKCISVELWNYTLAIRTASSESSQSIKGVFTRIGVACASQEVVETLVDRILLAIEYWLEKQSNGMSDQKEHALSTLRVFIEVLARLVVRVPTEKAKEIFRLSLSLGKQKNLQHYWLFDAMNSLLTYSLKSVPVAEQGELLEATLAFPLQSEMSCRDFRNCPNPIINYPYDRTKYLVIGKRIGELIEALKSADKTSLTPILLRLLPLVKKEDFLTSVERENLAKAIWGDQPDYQALPNTDLFPHALLVLPTLDAKLAKELVHRYLYEYGNDVLTDAQKEIRSFPSPEIQKAIMIYAGMANAAAHNEIKLLPTPEKAVELFNRLVVYRPQIEKDDFFGFANNERKRLIESIGNALSYAIAPALSAEAKTVGRFEQLKAFYEEIEVVYSALPAFVYFACINDDIAATVEKNIRKSLQGRVAIEVSNAAIAIQKWMEIPESENSVQLNSLTARLIVIIESGRTVGLQQLIWVAGELFTNKRLSEDQIRTLIEATQNVFNAADYSNIEPNSREAISASSIREACVKLAKILFYQYPDESLLKELLENAKTDALPEVRFAV